jgi:hypothetical protein
MADLIVDYQLLDQTEGSLGSLAAEFQKLQALAKGYDGGLGSGDIASAMDDFAGNWDYHRKRLVGSMHALGQLVHETKHGFQDADQKLASSLTRKK